VIGTEQDGLVEILKICIREVFSSNIGQDTGYLEVFLSPLKENGP
jgi:hypothetical protein